MSDTLHGTSENFDELVLSSELPVLVDFWATWCGPCRMVSPIIDQIASDYEGRLRVVKVDVDEAPDIAERYSVASVPFLFVLRDGEVVKSISGARPRQVLEQELQPVL